MKFFTIIFVRKKNTRFFSVDKFYAIALNNHRFGNLAVNITRKHPDIFH